MKKRNYIGLLAMLFSVSTVFAQQAEMKKDSVNYGLELLAPIQKQKMHMDKEGFILPDGILIPTLNKSVLDLDSMTFRISMTEFRDTPWPVPKLGTLMNPYVNDYDRFDTFNINSKSYLNTYSLYNTFPTMGTHIQVGAIYSFRPNKRWELSGGFFSSKYTMPSFSHGAKMDFGFSGSAAYRINDFLRIRAYGEYSVNGEQNAADGYMTPILPQSYYGMILEIRLNDYVDIHGGMERSYNPMKGKWETYPVIHPVIYLKKRPK